MSRCFKKSPGSRRSAAAEGPRSAEGVNPANKIVGRKWLRQRGLCAEFPPNLQGVIASHDDNCRAFFELIQSAKERDAVHHGHFDIEDDHVGLLGLNELQRLQSIFCSEYAIACRLEDRALKVTNSGFVINYEYTFQEVQGRSGDINAR